MTTLDMTNSYTAMMFRLLQQRSALSVQVKTGLRHSQGSVMALIRRESTLIPNAFAPLHAGLIAEPGPEGVLVYREDRPARFGDDGHKAGDLMHVRIASTGTFIRVLEDLDARIVMLGGSPMGSIVEHRKGSTAKINEAAQRRHDRRIVRILELREKDAERQQA